MLYTHCGKKPRKTWLPGCHTVTIFTCLEKEMPSNVLCFKSLSNQNLIGTVIKIPTCSEMARENVELDVRIVSNLLWNEITYLGLFPELYRVLVFQLTKQTNWTDSRRTSNDSCDRKFTTKHLDLEWTKHEFSCMLEVVQLDGTPRELTFHFKLGCF